MQATLVAALGAAPTVFGCVECSDDLAHYLSCCSLWTIVESVTLPGYAPTTLSAPTRLCLAQPTFASLKACGIATWLYHAIKIGYRDRLEDLIDAQDFTSVQTLALGLISECPVDMTV